MQYLIRKSKRSKRIRISVGRDGSVVVSIPSRVAEWRAREFVESKKDWIEKQQNILQQKPPKILAHLTRLDFIKHKEIARDFVKNRVEYFNSYYGFSLGRISIRDQVSRWGSCSSRNNLNFNYKIVLLPQHLADYIIVHELCHLKEMNHGKKFWDLVSEQIPDFRECILELSRY